MSDPNNKNDGVLDDMALVGGLAVALPTIGYLSSMNDKYGITNKLASFNSKLIGSDYLNDQMNRVLTSTTGGQVLSNAEQNLKKTLLSQFMAVEEASPLHVVRTLQLSNYLQPFTPLSEANQTIHISGNAVRHQQHFYESLIRYINEDEQRKSKRRLEVKDLTRGFFFENNTLYGSTKEGLIDRNDVIFNKARLVMSSVKNGDIYSMNHIVEKYANNIGSSIDKVGARASPLMVIGSRSNMDFTNKWHNSTMRFAMEVGFKTLDNPLAGVEEMFHGVGLGHTGFFDSKIWNKAKSITGHFQLGTNGNYSMGIKDSLKLSAKNIAVKGSLAYLAYQGADSLLRNLSPSDGLFDQGLATGFANVYASSRIAFAEVFSDPFQGFKEKQEQSAPGSTDLTTLLAFPLAGALLGAQVSYFNRMGVAATKGLKTSAEIYNVESSSKLLKDTIGFDSKLKPMKRNALIGGLVGAAFTLPFLPGALVGTSSDELRDLYSGKKEVAEKANKFWTFGGTSWEGSHTKYHTLNWVARMRADATDKVRYGDDDTKKKLDPFLHPFSFIRDPYKFEKRNAESMPYPVWGMDVSYGSFFGKVFERTIGQVIKPDVINPAYFDAREELQAQHKQDIMSVGVGAVTAKRDVGKTFVSSLRNMFGMESDKSSPNIKGVDKKDASLIRDGLMAAPVEAGYNPNIEGLGLSYKALTDFTGIKGWTSSLVIDKMGVDVGTSNIQLARSGEASSSARDLLEQNLGDLLGCFTPNTLVTTENGQIPIKDVTEGIKVLSREDKYRFVKKVYTKEFSNIPILTVSTKTTSFTCTLDHVFPGIFQTEHSFVLKDHEIARYSIDDFLVNMSLNTFERITKIDLSYYTGKMYDLEIAPLNNADNLFVNYYVVNNILCHNSGEMQRKILPTSSGSLPDRFNPIVNNAVDWLPSDQSKYYLDFKHGNMYDKVDRGEERLPGVGYEALFPELKGIDPMDYPLVYKHKILSNIAKGSEEFINARKQSIQAYQEGKLSEREIEILGNTLEQEVERDHKKDFYQEPNKLRGPIGTIHNALWESMRTNIESPLEMLTPIRPAAKFFHKRTAIEDYIETQLGGPDTAIWTNPYSHFIKPALNKSRQTLDLTGTFIPEEAKEKNNIEEFFDKFAYLKARKNNSEFQSDRTVIGSSMSGLNTKEKILKFKSSLSADQRDYFDAFSKETDSGKRDKIRAIVPKDVLRGYEQIWQNVDIANKARKDGTNIQQALAENISNQTNSLKKTFNVDLTRSDKEKARSKVANNSDNYHDQGISEKDRIRFTEDEILRRKMADKEALTYLANRTGVPSSNFIGWDPRLKADDVKIRTLSIGGEDLKRFGFWKGDEERMNRLSAITKQDTSIFNEIDVIKESIKSDRRMKNNIEKTMFNNGFKVTKIDLVDSDYGSILVREN